MLSGQIETNEWKFITTITSRTLRWGEISLGYSELAKLGMYTKLPHTDRGNWYWSKNSKTITILKVAGNYSATLNRSEILIAIILITNITSGSVSASVSAFEPVSI